MKPATHDRPLPGDLVIAQCNTDPRQVDVFAVFIYPDAKLPRTLPTFADALHNARHVARANRATLQIWRLEPGGVSMFRKVGD